MERPDLDTIIINLENRISDLEIEFHMVVKNVESVLPSVVNQMKQVDRATELEQRIIDLEATLPAPEAKINRIGK